MEPGEFSSFPPTFEISRLRAGPRAPSLLLDLLPKVGG